MNQDYENAAVVRDKVIDLKKKLNLYTNIWEKNGGRPAKVVTASDIERIIRGKHAGYFCRSENRRHSVPAYSD